MSISLFFYFYAYVYIQTNKQKIKTHHHQVPPIIEPFSFQDGLAEGMRTRTVCGVSSGDMPLTLSWLKDGVPLSHSLGANITSLDLYSSYLSIPSLSASNSGDYTCVASNPAAETKFTATLMVKGTVYFVAFVWYGFYLI